MTIGGKLFNGFPGRFLITPGKVHDSQRSRLEWMSICSEKREAGVSPPW